MRLAPILIIPLIARLAAAQVLGPTAPAGATVTGVVRDSIGHSPLADAEVQLVSAGRSPRFGRTAISDSLGRFTLVGVPDGRYTIGFFHPLLDSLGVEPVLHEVVISASRPAHADLATPSAPQFRNAVCGPHKSDDSTAVVVGTVRDATDLSPLARVVVSGEWLEMSFTRDGIIRRAPRLDAVTADNGWFALCNVPGGGAMTLLARRGKDSTDIIDLELPPSGVVRRELYLGPTAIRDSVSNIDSAAGRHRLRTGAGQLRGKVVTALGAKPIAGADVSIVGGPRARTNERGEWTLSELPAGTRTLEVRAIGFYPDRRAVNVIPAAPPVRVALSTLKAVLEAIEVRATRPLFDRDRSGFQQRRRTGAGRYLTAGDIAIRSSIHASDIFRNLPGFHVQRDTDGFNNQILQRNPLGACSPTIFIDGRSLPFTADDLDDWISPTKIAAIEVYTEVNAPPQFREYSRMDACGSIVIWTK